MCLILIAHGVHPQAPLVVAANRDEFYARPTASAHYWHGERRLLAGQDLEAGGTWLGVAGNGRFAAVTNVAETPPTDLMRSRGDLVTAFLECDLAAAEYAGGLEGARYRGYNLLLWDGEALVYSSNRAATCSLGPGIYGLANASLDEDRHKVQRGTALLRAALSNCEDSAALSAALAALLVDCEPPADAEPAGAGRSQGACFIVGTEYGTRASTTVIIEPDRVRFGEQTFTSGGTPAGRSNHEFNRQVAGISTAR